MHLPEAAATSGEVNRSAGHSTQGHASTSATTMAWSFLQQGSSRVGIMQIEPTSALRAFVEKTSDRAIQDTLDR